MRRGVGVRRICVNVRVSCNGVVACMRCVYLGEVEFVVFKWV